MIDSIALTLEMNQITVTNPDAFTPSAKGLLMPPYYPVRGRGMSCVCNPTKADTLNYGYMPRLTLSKRPATHGFSQTLRVDISLPKLKFGNNFDELNEKDFTFLCDRLAQQMGRMGVKVSAESICKANVSAVHFSKNMPLTDYTSCQMVIAAIAKCNVVKRLDSVKTDYRNDGAAIRFHASAYEVIVYDKLKDLQRGKTRDKRAVENENAMQLPLLLEPFQKPFEVLRIEVRLGNRKKIKSLLDKLDLSRPLTFESLFFEKVAKTVLLHYWDMIVKDAPLIVASSFSDSELYDEICRADGKKTNHAQALRLVGAIAIIRKEGLGGLRARVERYGTSRTWYRLKSQLDQLSITSNMRYNALRVAENHLRAFKALRLEDFKKVKANAKTA